MATIVTRAIKGSALTWTEADANFTNLNTAVVTAQTEIDAAETVSATKVAKAGDTMTGALVIEANSATPFTGLTVENTDDEAISEARILIVSDGGQLEISSTPAGDFITSTQGLTITTTNADDLSLGAGSDTALTIDGTTQVATFDENVVMPTFTLGATAVTATGAELNFVDGVTSAIQTQIDTKAPVASPTFTTQITSPIVDITNYVDFTEVSEPGNPSSGDLRLWAESIAGFGQLHYKNSAGLNYQLGRDNLHTVRNTTGSTITKGSWVYISGSTGSRPNIALAQANSASTVPVAGLVVADISNNANGQMMTLGDAEDLDTTAFNDGDLLYLSSSVAGGATTTVPTGTNIVQRLGVVIKDHASTGIIAVLVGGEFNPALTQTLSNKTVLGPEASEVVTATNVIAATESGTTFFLNSATEFVSTLPAPAAGLRFTFICTAAPSGASYTVITNSSANIIIGQQQSVAGDAGDFGTADDTISFVDGQAVAGDRVDVISDGTSWFAYAQSKVAAGITFTQASA